MRSVAIAGLFALVATSANAEAFNLVCDGVGDRLVRSTGFATATGSGGSASGTINSYSVGQSDQTLTIEIDGSTGRVRPPIDIVPPLHGGGQDGWWNLTDISVSDDQITARFHLNWLNNPRITIDRHTGHISLVGYTFTRFEGGCRPFDPSPAARQF